MNIPSFIDDFPSKPPFVESFALLKIFVARDLGRIGALASGGVFDTAALSPCMTAAFAVAAAGSPCHVSLHDRDGQKCELEDCWEKSNCISGVYAGNFL